MRLKHQFEIMDLDDRVIAVPVGDGAEMYHGVFKMNETAAVIFNLLNEETTEEAIVAFMKEKYSAPIDLLTEDVHKYIEEFKKNDMLVM